MIMCILINTFGASIYLHRAEAWQKNANALAMSCKLQLQWRDSVPTLVELNC